jgi:hypothetical protein
MAGLHRVCRRSCLLALALLLVGSPASGSKNRRRAPKHRGKVASGRTASTNYTDRAPQRKSGQRDRQPKKLLPQTSRPLILVDTNLLISAKQGCGISLRELDNCATMITKSQRGEFLDVKRSRRVRRRFLAKHNVMGIPHEKELRDSSEYVRVFDLLKPLHGRGDATLGASAAALIQKQGYSLNGRPAFEVVTADRDLIRSLESLQIPVRAVYGVRPGE